LSEVENLPVNNQFRLKSSSGFSFEIFGIAHNDWMDYIASDSNFVTWYDEDMFDWASSYSFPIIPEYGITYSEFRDAELYTMMLAGESDRGAALILTEVDSIYDTSMFSVLKEMFRILKKDTVISTYQNKIVALEKNLIDDYPLIYDDSTYVGNATAVLLGACAIARNSGDYWYNAEHNSSNPWHSRIMSLPAPNPSSPSPHLRLPRWLRAAFADVGSFFGDTGSCWHKERDPYGNVSYWYDLNGAFEIAGNASCDVQ